MNQDVLRAAIKQLEDDLGKIIVEAKKRKQAINVLYETLGESPPYDIEGESGGHQLMRPDLFYGKAFAVAASELQNS